MLGESFIHVFKYRQEDAHLQDVSRPSLVPSADGHDSSVTFAPEDMPASVQPEAAGMKCALKPVPHAAAGFCSSNHKSHVSLRHSQDLSHISDNFSPTYLELHFSNLPRQEFPSRSPADCEPRQLRSIPSPQACMPDDGYLVMDSSIVLNGELPTNSMLNGYLDRKLREVYSQYLQERLACPNSSPACSMLPPLSQASLLQLNQQLTLDLSLEPGQGPPSQHVSSHFSTPLLRISNTEQPKTRPPRPPDCL